MQLRTQFPKLDSEVLIDANLPSNGTEKQPKISSILSSIIAGIKKTINST